MSPRVRAAAAAAALMAMVAGAGCQERADPSQSAQEQSAAQKGAGVASPFSLEKIEPESLGPPAEGEARAFYEGEFEAVGVEPNWTLDLLEDYAVFERPGLDSVPGIPQPRDIRANGAIVDVGAFSVVLRAGACVHTSGETFPYVATVVFDGVGYRGCARRAEGGGATPTWSALLPELIPAIDICLARLQSQPGRVSIAYVFDQAQTNVRMIDADGGRYECGVAVETSEIAYFEPIPDRDVLQGERDPLFTRAPLAPPEGQCFENAPVLSADGAQLGTVTRRVC